MGGRRGKGEGSIYQRDDGVWIGAIDLGWRNGKRVRKVVNGKTRGEVAKRVRELQPVITQGVTPASDRLTVAEYLNGWIVNRIPGTITTRTETMYERAVQSYINPSIGKVRLNKLSPSDVSRMLHDLEEKGYSPATRRMARATLRRALRMAQQDGILSRNVASIAEGPKLDHREGRSLTPDQARQFLLTVRGHRHEAAYVIALSLGLRRGEILGLRRRDIDLLHATVRIEQSRTFTMGGVSLTKSPKTTAGFRTLAVPRPVLEAIEAHLNAFTGAAPDSLVINGKAGRPLTPNVLQVSWQRARESISRPDLRLHDLRHTGLTFAAAAGATTVELMHRAGHSSSAAAMRYQHATRDRDRVLADALASMVKPSPAVASELRSKRSK